MNAEEPFSRIVRVKSPRVWDVICSTLVLYRGTTGLGRGVGVFKGDYTQRQGWLYWRTEAAVLTARPASREKLRGKCAGQDTPGDKSGRKTSQEISTT